MDDFDGPGGDEAPNLFLMHDVRIMHINYFVPRCDWIGPLLLEAQPNIIPNFQPRDRATCTLERSLRIFKGLNVRGGPASGGAAIGGGSTSHDDGTAATEEEPLDLDGVMSAAGYDDSEGNELAYDQAWEKRFGSLRSVIGATAECLVEYTPASSGGGKRARSVPSRAHVYGEWPILSRAVRYNIGALPYVATEQRLLPGTPPKYDAIRSGCYIAPAGRVRASVSDFSIVLLDGARMHVNAVGQIMRRLFPTVYGLPLNDANRERVVHRSLLNGDGGRELDSAEPHNNTFEIDELSRLLDGLSTDISWLTIDAPRSYFQTATMFFYSRELERLATAYRTKNRWFDILARGRQFVRHVHALLCTEPQTLCIKSRKYVEAVRRQRELRQRRRRLVGDRDTPRLALAAIDAECAAMRALITLPERPAATYRETMAQNAALGYASSLSEAEQAVIATAVDVYALLVHDTVARDDLYANLVHRKRVRDSEHGASSGHMFTVFDSTPRAVVQNSDSAGSLGSFTLDHWPLAAPPPPPPPPPQTLEPPPGTTIDDDGSIDTLLSVPLTLPLAPVATARRVQPDALDVARARSGVELCDAISRLATECRAAQFVAGLRWLIDHQVVTRVPMTGSGPRNDGAPFDGFYLSSVFGTQTRCLTTLRDIYERGVRHAVAQHGAVSSAAYDIEAAVEQHAARLARFREKCAFFTQARVYARLLGLKHSELLSRSRDAAAGAIDDIVSNDLLHGEAPETPAPPTPIERLYEMAATLLAQVKEFVAADDGDDASIDSAYADLVPAPAPGERQLTFGLLQAPVGADDSQDEIQMCDEQLRAIERSLCSPVSIITGRGGTGKTEALSKIIARYAPEQVLVTAFTGKVVSELTRRVHKARTMHSLLVSDVLHRQECRRVESIIAALRGRVRQSGDRDGLLARLTDIRAELYRLLGVAEHVSPFENVRVLVIDEASLMPFEMFAQLLAAIHEHNKCTGKFLVRLIVCGDPSQLFPIAYGAVLSDLCHALPHCVHHMTINHRSEGTAIFSLANNIAQRRFGTPGVPWPVFGGVRNERRLRTSTQAVFAGDETLDAQMRLKREADDASVVFMEASPQDLEHALHRVLDMLGCFAVPETPEVVARREAIMMISPTRTVVGKLNRAARAMFFARAITAAGGTMQQSLSGEPMMPPEFEQRLLSGELCILKSNFARIDYVAADAVDADEDGGEVAPAVRQLIEIATDVGLQQPQSGELRRVVTSFYNGQLLLSVGFYDAPARITEATSCRCGKHPAPERGEPAVHWPCVLQPHEVPSTRRTPTDYSDPFAIKWHTHGLRYRNGGLEYADGSTNKRRMAVFRVVNEPDRYKEVDVAAKLANTSQFAFAEAATIHVIQGSESPCVIFVVDRDNTYFDWSMVYTACTRPRQRLVVLGEPDAFRAMVQREPPKRRSELFWLLAGEVAEVHTAYDTPDDEWAVARAMHIDDDLTRTFVSTRRRAADLTRSSVWCEYDRVKEAALARGEQ